MNTQQIVIIIVTFNSEKYIGNCLKSIYKHAPKNCKLRTLVIDNNSSDKTLKITDGLKKKISNLVVINNESNKGFAKAVNQGIKISKNADYVLLLNPDTVLDRGSIGCLLRCAKSNKAGIVGGSTFNSKGNENGSYFRFPNIKVGLFDFTNLRKIIGNDYWHNYFYYKNDNFRKINFPVDVVTGGYMLISKNTIKNIGLFDESYFMYLEDVDFCLRAKTNGIKIFHCNSAHIVHFSGKSSNNKEGVRHSSWLWSRKIYFLKHFGILDNLIIQPIFLLDDIFILSKIYFKHR